MKVVILAGGNPSTIAEERDNIPKPMLHIGENPIIWHIMKSYAAHGLTDFILCAGYKIDTIKDYFNDFYIYQSDITVDLRSNTIKIHNNISEDWKVTIVNTGLYSSTGQRLSMIQKYIEEEEFMVTYGDCLSDINTEDVITYHRQMQRLATMVVAKPTGRNTIIPLDEEDSYLGSHSIIEDRASAWTNTGTYLFNHQVFQYLMGNYALEQQLLEVLAEKHQITAYKHKGFWAPVETRRDKEKMESLWNADLAPWKNW